MKFLKTYGLFIYWAVLLLDCLVINYGMMEYHTYLKLMLMPILAIYFFIHTKRSKHYSKKIQVYLALIAALIGDYFLLQNGSNNFIIGMVCFVIAYSIYGFMFANMQSLNFKDAQEAFFTLLAMLVVSGVLYKVLQFGNMYNLNSYILVYMGVMSVVTALAVNIVKNKRINNTALSKIIPGVLMLCVSDAILSVHKFYLTDIEFLPLVVMLTYGFGQSLIIGAFAKYLKS